MAGMKSVCCCLQIPLVPVLLFLGRCFLFHHSVQNAGMCKHTMICPFCVQCPMPPSAVMEFRVKERSFPSLQPALRLRTSWQLVRNLNISPRITVRCVL